MCVLLIRREPMVAIGCIVFFGACLVMWCVNIGRKLRFARLRPLSVEIVGGVPLRPSRVRTALLGGSVLVVGLGVLPLGLARSTMVTACAVLMMAVGALLLGGVLLRKLPVGFLQFDEVGLTVGERIGNFTIGWDNILGAWPAEFHDNAALFLSVRNLDGLTVSPPEAKQKVIVRLRRNEAWVGAHVMVLTGSYGIDLPLLAAAIGRYVTEPNSRAGLSVPRLPAAP